jgi:hypothetical protein
VLCGGAVFGATAVFAAGLETPVLLVENVKATEATFVAVLDPVAPVPLAEGGTYQFIYRATSSKACRGAGEVAVPVSPSMDFGDPHEEYSEPVAKLAEDTEYAVCVVQENDAKTERVESPIETFTTAIPPEKPVTTSPAAATITSSSATLRGVLNPTNEGNPGSYEFLYRASSSECQGDGEEKAGGEAHGVKGEAVSSEVGGLRANTQYTVCLLARNEAGETAVSSSVTFTTLVGEPTVNGVTVSRLGTRSATVSAELGTGNAETTYVVQYGTSTAYGAETSPGKIAVNETASVELTGLQSGVEYNFRFVASNEAGSRSSADARFTTYTVSFGLPDGRVYEMVSPPENHDADVYALESGEEMFANETQASRAAANGNAVAYVAAPTIGGNGLGGEELGDQYLAMRSPGGGWSQTNITPSGEIGGYDAFSSNLTEGIFSVEAEPPFVATQNPPYLGQQEAYHFLYDRNFDESDYQPVFTVSPQYRTRVEFGVGTAYGSIKGEPLVYAGASAAVNDVLFEANDDLLSEDNGHVEQELSHDVQAEAERRALQLKLIEEEQALEGAQKNQELRKKEEELEAFELANDPLDNRAELYVSDNGRVSLVNILPDGTIEPGSTFGGGSEKIHTYETIRNLSHVISSDGSVVFWTGRSGVVYARVDGSRTVQVSAGSARYWASSAEGGFAFYIEAGKLWRFDMESEARTEIAGGSGEVIGVIGTNETGTEGAYVYFVASEAIPGLENGAGQSPRVGGNNLYVYESDSEHVGQSHIAFIGALSAQDASDWYFGLGGRTAEPTPNGEYLVFTSHEDLAETPYQSEGAEEVYVYDANDASLFCASCRPQGNGGHLNYNRVATYMFRWISEGGDRVFFDSSAPLVAQDVDGKQNVYEWERPGSGECSETEGCVYILSGGVEYPASLLDTSANGNDAFFVTRERLVPEDRNENVNLYDARVDGALPVSPPECVGTGCQGPPAAAPLFATPASVTFAGVGDFPPPTTTPVIGAKKAKARPLTRTQKLARALKACRKKPKGDARSVCESRAHKQYAEKTNKRTSKGAGK